MIPVTVVDTKIADEVYQETLSTPFFVVPINQPERLKLWPQLKSKEFEITGVNTNESAADILLSNAGKFKIII